MEKRPAKTTRTDKLFHKTKLYRYGYASVVDEEVLCGNDVRIQHRHDCFAHNSSYFRCSMTTLKPDDRNSGVCPKSTSASTDRDAGVDRKSTRLNSRH